MRRGFVLVEFLLALMLAALIMIGATTMLLAWHRQASSISRVATESMAVAHACSCMTRELSHAPQALERWKKRDKSEAIWICVSQRDRGLCVRKGRLILLEGTYDSVAGQWHSSTQSTLCDDVSDLVFEYVVNNQSVHRVHCSFHVYNQTPSFNVYCRDQMVILLAGLP